MKYSFRIIANIHLTNFIVIVLRFIDRIKLHLEWWTVRLVAMRNQRLRHYSNRFMTFAINERSISYSFPQLLPKQFKSSRTSVVRYLTMIFYLMSTEFIFLLRRWARRCSKSLMKTGRAFFKRWDRELRFEVLDTEKLDRQKSSSMT